MKSQTLIDILLLIAVMSTGALFAFDVFGEGWLMPFLFFVGGFVARDGFLSMKRSSENFEGPAIPCGEMYVGEKFAYYLPAITLLVFGSTILAVAVHDSYRLPAWGLMAVASLLLAYGLAVGVVLWQRRSDA